MGPRCNALLRAGGVLAAGAGVASLDFWYSRELTLKTRPDGQPDTYWATCVKEPAVDRAPLAAGTARASVVVVGGGLAGLHVALALAEKGQRDVVVLDKGRIGWGASGMSKGLAVAGVQVDQCDVAAGIGEDDAQSIYDLTLKGQDRLLALIAKYKIACDAVVTGGATVSAFKPDPEADTADPSYWDQAKVQQVTGSPLYKWGEYGDTTVGLNPLGLTRGLARACESLGVSVFENSKVSRVARRAAGGGWEVETVGGGRVECNEVVLCGAGTIDGVNGTMERATVPVYTYMAATEPLGDRLPLKDEKDASGKVLRPAPLICDDFLSLNYFRNTEDGRLLFGGLAECYPAGMSGAEGRLRKELERVYPQLAGVKFDHFWGGTLAMGRNAMPMIGRGSDGLWYSSGFGGHGIVPTCMAGTLVADALVDGDETYSVFQRHYPQTYCGWPFSRLGGTVALQAFAVLDTLRAKGFPVPDVPKPW